MGVKLLFTLLCDDVRVENSGKFILVGIYNYALTFQPIATGAGGIPPATQFNMQKLCLFRRWDTDLTDFQVKTDIVGPDGKVVMSFSSKLVKPQDGAFCQEIVQLFGPVFSPGVHKIVTKYQDGDAGHIEDLFDVRVAPMTVGQPVG
jgi:hypothetical protein